MEWKKELLRGFFFYWLEKGLGGRIFRPASLGALWVLGISVNLSLYQLQRESLHNRAYARGNAPRLVPAAPLPPEGEVCSPLGLCSHKNRDGKHRANLPHRGRCRRQKGCISIGPKNRFACFPPPARAVLRFYPNWCRRRPPPPSEPSEPSRPKGCPT